MKVLLLFALLLVGLVRTPAQPHAALTGIRDTSYTVGKEYTRQLASYSFIRLPVSAEAGKVRILRNISYCTTRESELLLDIYSLAGDSQPGRPALLFLHGGGWRSGSKDMHAALLERLASRGYVCIAPAYRLSTEALYPAALYDVKSAIRWTRAHAREYAIDTQRIVVAGHSAGGELAAMAGATNGNPAFEGDGCCREWSSKADAVIDLDGILAFIHPESGEGDDSKKTSAATLWFGYSKTENPSLWKEASPLSHTGPWCPPCLFINSGAARMHAGRDDFIGQLKQYGIPCQVKSFPEAPHSFLFFEPWQSDIVEEMDRFMKALSIP